ncbi:Hypothetical predicted protein [Cloeon dipterum]|uniref:Uncharacterized protein n=1 Tax=Cloeon dipterum TaxID=197152 RepID=A0A8S1DZF7_9INSE|nr:Hypothetical predicted protein [Cloeon dipterum]
MHIKRKQLYVLTLSFFALVSLVYINAKDRLKTLLHDESTLRERALLQLNWSSNCVPSDHIFFLKTHKCASSTVQNILMRRGFEKGLNFVLPEKGNYMGHPYFLDETKHIGKGLLAENEE